MSILVLGSLNMDMVVGVKRMPSIGETIKGGGFFKNCGGKGANQTLAAQKLMNNGNVTMIGAVGNDDFGKELMDNLNKFGVNTKNIIKTNKSTGTASITLVGNDNFIILDEGANGELTWDKIVGLEDVFKENNYLIMQLEIPIETVENAMILGKKHNLKIVLNPAPAVKLKEEVFKNIDILVLNETETEILSGVNINEDATCIPKALKFFTDKGCKKVIITMGENGVAYNDDKSNAIFKKAVKVNAVDTTSAGDAFIGGLVATLDKGENFDEAVEFAIFASALTVTKKGAQESLPTFEEVKSFMQKTVTSYNYYL